ncbi:MULTISPECIES: hypothetical protein [Leisingera]|jgi:hypothetical protein|uniref:hypothetical protein n=1 Tax=Leisingera TaxID=191028 RepID=UPI000416FEEC|nr:MULTISPECIES: hypothetical protein [Leisingera]KIC31487.1 hypothetical protein RA25_15240 [Leisingera sp. ANG-S5]MCB4455030.1 hypothetical protein [Leisingera sp. McT4-56]
MADTFRIMRECALKDPWPASVADGSPTFINHTFGALTKAVDEALNLERDLSHSLAWDPACTNFQEAAEAKWQDCLKLSGDILTAQVVRASDLPLQRMSMLLHFLIESTGPEEALRFQQLFHENQELFTVEDGDCQALLQTGARQMNALIELSVAAEAQNFLPN